VRLILNGNPAEVATARSNDRSPVLMIDRVSLCEDKGQQEEVKTEPLFCKEYLPGNAQKAIEPFFLSMFSFLFLLLLLSRCLCQEASNNCISRFIV